MCADLLWALHEHAVLDEDVGAASKRSSAEETVDGQGGSGEDAPRGHAHADAPARVRIVEFAIPPLPSDQLPELTSAVVRALGSPLIRLVGADREALHAVGCRLRDLEIVLAASAYFAPSVNAQSRNDATALADAVLSVRWLPATLIAAIVGPCRLLLSDLLRSPGKLSVSGRAVPLMATVAEQLGAHDLALLPQARA